MRMLIHTIGGTHEVDLADLVSIEIDTEAAPLFDLMMIDDGQAIQVRAIGPEMGLLIRPLGSNTVELRAAGLQLRNEV